MTNANHMDVATTIQAQLGGRAFVMMGAKNLLAVSGPLPGLQFKVGANAKKVTHIRIELAENDTYTVSFHKVRGLDCKELERVEFVHNDALARVIESSTGLYLSL